MTIHPIVQGHYGLAEHKFTRHAVSVQNDLDEESIATPELFTNIANKLTIGDEIRAMAHDESFLANLLVTFVRGADVRVKVLEFYTFDDHQDDDDDENERYVVKLCGSKKFCIIDTTDNSTIKEGLPNKQIAYRELDDYVKAMNR